MKWLGFTHQGRTGFGKVEGEDVLCHSGDMFNAPQATGERLALDRIEYLAPCAPGKIIGLWNNFRATAEKNGWAAPAEPLYFLKCLAAQPGTWHRLPCLPRTTAAENHRPVEQLPRRRREERLGARRPSRCTS